MRFSVYIPVWNGAGWIGRAIESVLAQTSSDWELVIGDNASTDRTAAVVAQYQDPRIRYRHWPTFAEISENYNRTLLMCEGEWTQLLAADDRLDPICLQRMAERIDRAAEVGVDLAVVLTACRRVGPDGRPADREWYGHGRIAEFHDGTYRSDEWLTAVVAPGVMPWNSGSIAIRSDVIHELGSLYRPETGVCADLELCLRASAYGSVAYVDEPLLHFTVHGASDGTNRIRRDLEAGEPIGPLGLAMLAGLRIHAKRRTVSKAERGAVRAAVARELLGRALLHRYHDGGRGRRGAVREVARALRWSAGTVLSPRQLAKAGGSLFAPRFVLDRGRNVLASRRRARDGSADPPSAGTPS